MCKFPVSWVRENFPALNVSDEFVFFDNGAGAQIPQAAAPDPMQGSAWRQIPAQRAG